MIESAQTYLIRQKLQGVLVPPTHELGSTITLQTGIKIIDIQELLVDMESNPGLIESVLTPAEISYCAGKAEKHAGRIAGKQSVMEALEEDLPWQDIVILPATPAVRRPVVQLFDMARKRAVERGVETTSISISHDEGFAVGLAVCASSSNSFAFNIQPGTDIASVERIASSLANHPQRFLLKRYTPLEIDQSDGNPVLLTERWAAKEAVAKALGTGFGHESVAWKEIEILKNSNGVYEIGLSGAASDKAQREGLYNWNLTIVPNSKTPIAFVIGYS